MSYRVFQTETGKWSVQAFHAGGEIIAVGFESGSAAAAWLASHLWQLGV